MQQMCYALKCQESTCFLEQQRITIDNSSLILLSLAQCIKDCERLGLQGVARWQQKMELVYSTEVEFALLTQQSQVQIFPKSPFSGN